MRLRLGMYVCVALAAIVSIKGLTAQQSNVPQKSDTQRKTGAAKMEFEVASVREDKGPFTPPNFALSVDDAYLANTDSLTADFPLSAYIEFAYKLWPTPDERHALYDPLPKWVTTDRYKIQAKVDHPATKDEMRLMVQSLLADRFGLKLHFENKEVPVLAMTLAKPGVLGPRLRPAGEGVACDAPRPALPKGDPKTMSVDEIPWTCNYTLMPRSGKMLLGGARQTSTDLIAKFIGSLAGNFGLISRPVVDQTGLTGKYDFTMEFAQPQREDADAGAGADQTAPAGPDMIEAARQQLGLQFKPEKAVVSLMVIDHVERPSEN